MTDEEIGAWMSKKMDEAVERAIYGGPRPKPRQTALRTRPGRRFEVVELDDNGNIIEPPRPCPKCGPILLCIKHAAMVA